MTGNGAGIGYHVMSEAFPITAAPTALAGRMSGKVCLVTGGGSGIGRAAALRMAQEGAEAVLIAGRGRARSKRLRRNAGPAARRRSRSGPM